MANKLKVLMCSEASFLNSGFGTYTKEVLSRLHKTNKYEIAEFASYGFVNDPRDRSIDWIYYANAVREDDPRHKEYSSRQDNQFGRWRFEKVLLDFKPDVVIDVRDYWMSAYQSYSPFRKYFHWILMPTVDSEPQQEDWIDTFLSADAVFTYSDWGAEVLNRQSSGKIKYIDTTAPGVDLKAFNLKDINSRLSLRQKMGIPSDAIVFGTVMRNQKRKLFPELFITFRELLDKLEAENKPEIAKKLYLHIHTSYPDMGWDIPELLKESRIANKVLITYSCKNCKNVLASTFCGPIRNCPKCLSKSMGFTSVGDGVSSETLSDIYNCFDIYIQYAICEGFGMPQVEAGACGVPVFTVEYSAMIDIINKLNATPIKVKSRFKELETKAMRVYPDNRDLTNKLLDFLLLSNHEKLSRSKDIRKLTAKHFDWDVPFRKWERYFDSLDAKGYRANWDKPSNYLREIKISDNHNSENFDLLMYACNNNLNNYNLMSSMIFLNMLKDLDYGFMQNGMQIQGYSLEDAITTINTMIDNNNAVEPVRLENIKFDDDFIRYSDMKGSSK